MSINSVKQNQGNSTISVVQSSVINQGKNLLIGAGAGLVAGNVVSVLCPVSNEKIANELIDYYCNNDQTLFNKVKELKNSIMTGNITEEQMKKTLKKIEEIQASLKTKAKQEIDRFLNLARKDRSKDDIVFLAKKAAKKTQNAKIIGSAVAVGIFAMLFSDLFSTFLPKRNVANEKTAASTINTKLGTHQG